MKPFLVNVSTEFTQSFSARCDVSPDINSMWHYHAPLEFIYFKKGRGLQFVGDSVKHFKEGDVVIIGKNLPHYWRFDQIFFNGSDEIEVYVIHFDEDFLGDKFINLPEISSIKKVLADSRMGLQITGKGKKNLAQILPKIVVSEGLNRFFFLLKALQVVANSSEVVVLASRIFDDHQQEGEINRMQSIYNYSLNNYKRNIKLTEIANVAKLTPNSFCKFFKSKNKKTYTRFINEIRIGQACKFLIENQLTVKEICYECGFNNFTSFHKFFKDIKGKSPLKYRDEIFCVK